MTKKEIPRKYIDLFHVTIYIVILLWFANFESERKAYQEETTVTTRYSFFPAFAKVKNH